MRRAKLMDLVLLGLCAFMETAGRLPSELPRRALAVALALAGVAWRPRQARSALAKLSRAAAQEATPVTRIRELIRSRSGRWEDLMSLRPFPGAAARDADVDVLGLEHIETALEARRGAILWYSLVFGRRYCGIRVLHARGLPLCQVHAGTHFGGGSQTGLSERIIRPYFLELERRYLADIVEVSRGSAMSDTRRMMQALRANRLLHISGDGPIGQRHYEVAFLDRRMKLASGPFTLARATGAPVIPFFVYPVSGRMTAMVEAPVMVAPDEDAAALERHAQHCAHLFETHVRRCPSEYRKWHAVGAQPTETT